MTSATATAKSVIEREIRRYEEKNEQLEEDIAGMTENIHASEAQRDDNLGVIGVLKRSLRTAR